MSEYQRVIEELFTRRTTAQDRDNPLLEILEQWGNPQEKFSVVHIAGTNGKGSVAMKIAKALQKGGVSVGLFTSPHLIDFEERIVVNDEQISQPEVIAYSEKLNKLIKKHGWEPHFFDCCFAFALRHFAEQKVEIAIIEAGIGGAEDATNIVTPELTIITTIGLDHAEYLGETIEEVASHKAGIIKKDVPVVVGPRAQLPPVFQRAEAVGAPMHIVKTLSPLCELENRAIAKRALELLFSKFPINSQAVNFGIEFRPSCRFEKRGNVSYDVAHNPDGFGSLAKMLKHFFKGGL